MHQGTLKLHDKQAADIDMNSKASSMPQSRLVHKLELLLLRHNSGFVLIPRKVMSRRKRKTLPKNKHGQETGRVLW